MDDAIEKSAMRKIYIRLLPFAILILACCLNTALQSLALNSSLS